MFQLYISALLVNKGSCNTYVDIKDGWTPYRSARGGESNYSVPAEIGLERVR